jgi:hypothetical protein
MRSFNMKRFLSSLAALVCLCVQAPTLSAEGNYKNFRVAVYIRVHQVQEFKDPNWLPARWDALTREVKVDKVYIETYRDDVVADEQAIVNGKEVLRIQRRGSGGRYRRRS